MGESVAFPITGRHHRQQHPNFSSGAASRRYFGWRRAVARRALGSASGLARRKALAVRTIWRRRQMGGGQLPAICRPQRYDFSSFYPPFYLTFLLRLAASYSYSLRAEIRGEIILATCYPSMPCAIKYHNYFACKKPHAKIIQQIIEVCVGGVGVRMVCEWCACGCASGCVCILAPFIYFLSMIHHDSREKKQYPWDTLQR